MGLVNYRLGELIQIEDERNTEGKYTLDDVRGISIQKIFIGTKADMTDVSLSPYIIVRPGAFAYVPVTSRNGEKITIARNDTNDTYIVSTSYIVFSIKRTDILLPEYLFMYFSRSEFDRYARFNSWGSAREAFNWEDMCNVNIPVPPMDIQRKYVRVYEAMTENQRVYSHGLDDLRLVCDMFIEDLRRKMTCERLGDYITRHNVRNGENGTKNVKCVSTTKEFRKVGAKVDTENLANYKVCRPRQFAFVHTTNHEKVFTYAFNNTNEDIVVSSVNDVFSVDESIILSEYLCMWFNRPEFDRYARFHSWGSVREVFTWESLCEVKIPIPDIKIQRSIANIYTAYQTRKSISERLKAKIKSICPVLIKGAIDEAQKEIKS